MIGMTLHPVTLQHIYANALGCGYNNDIHPRFTVYFKKDSEAFSNFKEVIVYTVASEYNYNFINFSAFIESIYIPDGINPIYTFLVSSNITIDNWPFKKMAFKTRTDMEDRTLVYGFPKNIWKKPEVIKTPIRKMWFE